MTPHLTPEQLRLDEDARREKNWKRWGPYLSERQWGTVREDYSANGDAWNSFPLDHARSRTYRWGEDGLLGITDRECRLCFALALWNGHDPFLKERLFGLPNPQGNHGEDVKEWYWYLDSTPTHSYMRALYKYPQAEFPYCRLIEENARRSRLEPEFELNETGIFDDNRYFDVIAEYAKSTTDDLLIRITVHNRGPEAATIHVLPTLWFRNTWSWGGNEDKPLLRNAAAGANVRAIAAKQRVLGERFLYCEGTADLLFTENETNMERAFNQPNQQPYCKDGIIQHVVHGKKTTVNPQLQGTKAAAHHRLVVPARGSQTVRLRLTEQSPELLPAPF